METLALVLTDVQGSTSLWAEQPNAMDLAMRRHHEILHGAVARCGGFRPPDQGEGDAVFAAFTSPAAAIDAVAQMQRELHAEAWPTSRPLRVRIGVHVGEVHVRDGNLFGDPVNRCARIRGLAAGGQTLLSAAVFELVRDRLPADASVTDLGHHRMKDLGRVEHIHQLDVSGLRRDFPPLPSLERVRHNLPVHVTPFIGREPELLQLVDSVRRHRLVTLTGFGGMGKTRLALQAAADLAGASDTDSMGDVWFVDLTAEVDPAVVCARMAEVAGVGYRDDAGAALVSACRDVNALFVLDNLEQIPGCADVIADLLNRTTGLRVLATSREPLRVRAEHLLPLEPMRAPTGTTAATAESLASYDAVQFFAERAEAVKPDFRITAENAMAVAAVCARLDGHPLALELAAARLRVLSVEALLTRLDAALKVLTSGSRDMPNRHQTLRATIAWSFDALDPDEQTMLARIGALAGPADFDLVEAVCGGELDAFTVVSSLVDRNMVRTYEADSTYHDTHYGLLVAVREYALERLEPFTAGVLRDAYADYLIRVIGSASANGFATSIPLVSRLLPHIRAVLSERRADADDRYLAMVIVLEDHFVPLGFGREMETEINIALPRVTRSEDRAALLLALLHVTPTAKYLAVARRAYEMATASTAPYRIAWAASALVTGGASGAELEDALAAFARNRPRIPGDGGDYLDGVMAHSLGFALQYTDPPRAERVLRTQIAATPSHGALRIALARVLLDQGRAGQAEAVLDPEASRIEFEGPPWERLADVERGRVEMLRGRTATARVMVAPAFEYFVESGQFPMYSAPVLADIERADDAPGRVIEVVDRALATSDELGAETGEALRWRRGRAHLQMGDTDAARTDLDAAEAFLRDDDYRGQRELLGCLAARALMVMDDDPTAAAHILDTIAERRGGWVLPHLADRDVVAVSATLDRRR